MLHSYSFKKFLARLEYQSRPSMSGASSFKNLLARLPARVHSVYYRDEIGNISTSHLRIGSHKVQDILHKQKILINCYLIGSISGENLLSVGNLKPSIKNQNHILKFFKTSKIYLA